MLPGEVIPSFYQTRPMAARGSNGYDLTSLYVGEVLEVIYPDDDKSVSGKFVEYRVAAGIIDRTTGTPATIEFAHAILSNPLAGFPDRATWTLRGDSKSGQNGQPGVGSKVLLMCVNGDRSNAVILGGARDGRDEDDGRDSGHHLGFAFNGVELTVDDDGALEIVRQGPTLPDGTLNTKTEAKVSDQQVGQFLRMEADGSLAFGTVRGKDDNGDPKEEQTVVLDHAAKTLTVTAQSGLTIDVVDGPVTVQAKKQGVTIQADDGDVKVTAAGGNVILDAPKAKIQLGDGADEPAVLGNQLASFLNSLLSALQSLTVGTGTGPSSPPLNAQAFVQLAQQVDSLLSKAVDVKPSP